MTLLQRFGFQNKSKSHSQLQPIKEVMPVISTLADELACPRMLLMMNIGRKHLLLQRSKSVSPLNVCVYVYVLVSVPNFVTLYGL